MPSAPPRIRVMHVINNLAVGGAESMLARLSVSLRPEFDQSVVCLLDKGPLAALLESRGIPVIALGSSATIPSPWLPMRLAREIRRARPDIVQTWLYQSDLVGAVAARLAGRTRVVWNLRAADALLTSGHPVTRFVIRVCAALSKRLPSKIVCCAHSAATYHREAGYDPERMIVISNGVDTERFRPDAQARQSVRDELGIQRDAALVGLIARLHPQKDHATFFGAARLTAQVRPDIHYLLAGHRVQRDEPAIARWIAGPELSGRVHLLGERQDVSTLTAALDVATSVSAWGEGFPNALCEAMACGIPCVATDSGDATRIIGGLGTVVPKRDVRAVSDAWLNLLALPASARAALGDRARTHVLRHYDHRASVERYALLYRSLARDGR